MDPLLAVLHTFKVSPEAYKAWISWQDGSKAEKEKGEGKGWKKSVEGPWNIVLTLFFFSPVFRRAQVKSLELYIIKVSINNNPSKQWFLSCFGSFFLALPFNAFFPSICKSSSLLHGSVQVPWSAIKGIAFVYLILQWSPACQQLVKRHALNSAHSSWLWNYMGLKRVSLSSEHILSESPFQRSKWVETGIDGTLSFTLSFPVLNIVRTEEYKSSGQSLVPLSQIMWNNHNLCSSTVF